jgi:hypothetical protein
MSLIALSTGLSLSGCRSTPTLVLSGDRLITWAPQGATVTNQPGAYLVPPARMQEILRALAQPVSTNAAVHP